MPLFGRLELAHPVVTSVVLYTSKQNILSTNDNWNLISILIYLLWYPVPNETVSWMQFWSSASVLLLLLFRALLPDTLRRRLRLLGNQWWPMQSTPRTTRRSYYYFTLRHNFWFWYINIIKIGTTFYSSYMNIKTPTFIARSFPYSDGDKVA